MSEHVTAAEANRSLSLLLRRVREEGERFVMTSHGRPVVVLAPFEDDAAERKARAARRRAHLAEIVERLRANPLPDPGGRQWTRDELYARGGG